MNVTEYNAIIDQMLMDADKYLIIAVDAVELSGLSAAAEFISAARHVINQSSDAVIIESAQMGLRYIDYDVYDVDARRAARKALTDALKALVLAECENEAVLLVHDFINAAFAAIDKNQSDVITHARRALKRICSK